MASQDSSNLARYRRVALVFGREESGLTAEELEACSHLCSRQPSLNLSHAVAVCLAQCFDTTHPYVQEAQPVRAFGNFQDADRLQPSGGVRSVLASTRASDPVLYIDTRRQAGRGQKRPAAA
jgi:SpoU rRNA Methylase family